MVNYKQIFAIREKNKQRILAVDPYIPEKSGIYILTRYENGFKYCYVGQAKNILQRLADHLCGYQHIDNSIKIHGFYNEEKPNGWHIDFRLFAENELDKKEQEFILEYANKGYQMRNKTTGSQGIGKKDLGDKETKGYQQGLHNGYLKAQKEIAKLFNKNLKCEINGTTNKNKEKAMEKFKQFIQKGE